jgi:hypothetical protein
MSFTPPTNLQPRNQLWDFSGLNQGVDAVGKALDQRANRLMQEQQMAESKRRWEAGHSLAQERLKMAQSRANDPRIMNAGGNIVSVGPDGKPKVIYSPPQSGLDTEIKRARLKQLQQGRQPSELEQMKVQMLKQLMGGGQAAPAAPAQDPNLRLQSNETEPNADPNLIRTQTATTEPAPQGGPLAGLTPEQKRGMALNMISPGLGTPLMNQSKVQQFGKPAVNEIEKGIVNSENAYARLESIRTEFRPEFLTMAGGLKGSWIAFLDKVRMGQLKPTPEQEQYIADYARFKQGAWDNANRYIKEITGAQMSEAEAQRLLRALPDPGKSWYDGDGPAQFKAKLDKAFETMTLSRMRYHWMRSGGWNGTQMSAEDIASVMRSGKAPIALPKMRGIFNKRHNQIKQQLRRQMRGADPAEIDRQAIIQTQKEFGI